MRGVLRGDFHLRETLHIQPPLVWGYGFVLNRGNDSLSHPYASYSRLRCGRPGWGAGQDEIDATGELRRPRLPAVWKRSGRPRLTDCATVGLLLHLSREGRKVLREVKCAVAIRIGGVEYSLVFDSRLLGFLPIEGRILIGVCRSELVRDCGGELLLVE